MIVAGREGGADGVRIVLETEEAMLLSELADQVDSVLLLGGDDDPALGPAAARTPTPTTRRARATSPGTPARASSTASGRRRSRCAMRPATERGSGLVEIELDQAQAWDWLTFLTDLRLILAERVGVVDEDADEADEQRDDYLRAAYEWAGIVQGSMLEVLDPMQG